MHLESNRTFLGEGGGGEILSLLRWHSLGPEKFAILFLKKTLVKIVKN